ncbi:MAG: DUF1989 domain-containing protein [Verrucomicrobia bacterium]|nr:DUF1989 domain-containing protein [Verrucomicrobiota bacterium]
MNSERLSSGQVFASLVGAGTRLSIKTLADSSGACLFAWSAADPFDQLSDAYTFMELRRVWPQVKDCLFSTCRRPLFEILADSASPAIDLLRHNAWMKRKHMLETIGGFLHPAEEFSAPVQHAWPFPVNLFARTRMDRDGVLTSVPEVARRDHQIQLRAMTDLAVVLIAASHGVWKEAAVIEAGLAAQES